MADARFFGFLVLDRYRGDINPYTGDNAVEAMVLTQNYGFIDGRGVVWTAHIGDVVDGATIPGFAKVIIGGSFNTGYLGASVLHDIYGRSQERPWRDTDRMFYEAMRVNGVNYFKAWAMWSAVYAWHLAGNGW